MAIIDAKANIVQSYEYSAFGECLSGKDAVNAFRFVGGFGGQTDDATGLVYFWNRWYDPSVGRWISEDPIRQAGGVNLYGYVENGPTGFIDPFGLRNIRIKFQNGLPVDYETGNPILDTSLVVNFDSPDGTMSYYHNFTDDNYYVDEVWHNSLTERDEHTRFGFPPNTEWTKKAPPNRWDKLKDKLNGGCESHEGPPSIKG